MQPIIKADSWLQGARSAAQCNVLEARSLANALTDSDDFDSFWEGRRNALDAVRHQGWASLGMQAGKHGVALAKAGQLLDILKAGDSVRGGFWSGWSAESLLRDPERVAEMQRLRHSDASSG